MTYVKLSLTFKYPLILNPHLHVFVPVHQNFSATPVRAQKSSQPFISWVLGTEVAGA